MPSRSRSRSRSRRSRSASRRSKSRSQSRARSGSRSRGSRNIYCVKCRVKTPSSQLKVKTYRGRGNHMLYMLHGICSRCGTKTSVAITKEAYSSF